MIDSNFTQEVRFTLKFVALDKFVKHAKDYFVYYFQLDNGMELKMIKVFSDVAPSDAMGVIVSTYDNAVSIKIQKKGGA